MTTANTKLTVFTVPAGTGSVVVTAPEVHAGDIVLSAFDPVTGTDLGPLNNLSPIAPGENELVFNGNSPAAAGHIAIVLLQKAGT